MPDNSRGLRIVGMNAECRYFAENWPNSVDDDELASIKYRNSGTDVVHGIARSPDVALVEQRSPYRVGQEARPNRKTNTVNVLTCFGCPVDSVRLISAFYRQQMDNFSPTRIEVRPCVT